MIEITPEMLIAIAGPGLYKSVIIKRNRQRANFHALPLHMNIWFPVYEITKNLRIAHFLAQSCCETAYFLSLTESPIYGGLEYEPGTKVGRNIGNKYPGDGPKFIGRGLLHLTGRENYDNYGKMIEQDLVNHPESVATNLSLAVRTSCMYWLSRGLNRLADNDNFGEICYRVNGGSNGKDTRLRALGRAKKILGI